MTNAQAAKDSGFFLGRLDRRLRRRRPVARDRRAASRRDDQRALAGHRRHLRLSGRLPLLQPLHRRKGARPRRFPRHPGGPPQRRAGLRPNRQIRAVWPSFRGHRRRRPAGRPGAGGADGLSAGHALAAGRRGLRRRGAGFHRPVHLDPPRRPLARRPDQDGNGRRRRPHRAIRRAGDHDHPARRAGAGRGQGAGRQPLGNVHRLRHPAHRRADGRSTTASSAPAASAKCRSSASCC